MFITVQPKKNIFVINVELGTMLATGGKSPLDLIPALKKILV